MSSKSTSDLLAEFDAVDETEGTLFEPDYNVAPTTTVRAVLTRLPRVEQATPPEPVRQLRALRWGLVPSWAKDPSVGNRMFNARAETVPTKSAFAKAFAARRCLIPVDGGYEWRKGVDGTGKPVKQAFYMTAPGGASIGLAGLYEFWRSKDGPKGEPGEWLVSATIITVPSQGELTGIHERMPLVIDPVDWGRWLDPAAEGPVDLLAGWDEAAGEHLELRPVSAEVNSVRNNGPRLIDPVADPDSTPADQPQSLELF